MRAHPRRNHTLVVVMGSLRGGEQVWHTLEKNVLAPLQADLAVLAAEDQALNWLTQRARHVWRVGEYTDWAEPIVALHGPAWRSNVSLVDNLWGGVLL